MARWMEKGEGRRRRRREKNNESDIDCSTARIQIIALSHRKGATTTHYPHYETRHLRRQVQLQAAQQKNIIHTANTTQIAHIAHTTRLQCQFRQLGMPSCRPGLSCAEVRLVRALVPAPGSPADRAGDSGHMGRFVWYQVPGEREEEGQHQQ